MHWNGDLKSAEVYWSRLKCSFRNNLSLFLYFSLKWKGEVDWSRLMSTDVDWFGKVKSTDVDWSWLKSTELGRWNILKRRQKWWKVCVWATKSGKNLNLERWSVLIRLKWTEMDWCRLMSTELERWSLLKNAEIRWSLWTLFFVTWSRLKWKGEVYWSRLKSTEKWWAKNTEKYWSVLKSTQVDSCRLMCTRLW